MDNKIEKVIVNEQDEKGASMLEYALMAALIAVVCIAAVTFLGAEASKAFSTVGSSLANGNN
jgi:pilus assembly protein Flp/PilA